MKSLCVIRHLGLTHLGSRMGSLVLWFLSRAVKQKLSLLIECRVPAPSSRCISCHVLKEAKIRGVTFKSRGICHTTCTLLTAAASRR